MSTIKKTTPRPRSGVPPSDLAQAHYHPTQNEPGEEDHMHGDMGTSCAEGALSEP